MKENMVKELSCYDYRKELSSEKGNERIYLSVTVHTLDRKKEEEIFCKAEDFKEELKKVLAR